MGSCSSASVGVGKLVISTGKAMHSLSRSSLLISSFPIEGRPWVSLKTLMPAFLVVEPCSFVIVPFQRLSQLRAAPL